MFGTVDYRQKAKENEDIFRNILLDLKNNRLKRPMGEYIPENMNIEGSIDDLYERYSQGHRYGKFTINDFAIPEKTCARISFKDMACLSGGGATLEYLVREDKSVEYSKPFMVMMS